MNLYEDGHSFLNSSIAISLSSFFVKSVTISSARPLSPLRPHPTMELTRVQLFLHDVVELHVSDKVFAAVITHELIMTFSDPSWSGDIVLQSGFFCAAIKWIACNRKSLRIFDFSLCLKKKSTPEQNGFRYLNFMMILYHTFLQ